MQKQNAAEHKRRISATIKSWFYTGIILLGVIGIIIEILSSEKRYK